MTPRSHDPKLTFNDAYQQGHLEPFFALSGHAREAKTQALELPRDIDRQALANALGCYAKQLDAPAAVHATLEKLAHPESRAVVTGQQVGLLLGPTFTLAKAVTAIKLAAQLDSEECPVVPIFWLASQDHDSDEIDHTYLLADDEQVHRMQVPLPNDVPAGRITLEDAWLDTIKQEIDALPEGELAGMHKQDVVALLERTAARSHTFADWFASLLFELLGNQGLIIINPLDTCIAPHFHGVIKQELERPLASSEAINEAGDRLHELGYTPQLGRAEDATNLFFEVGGTRHLLRFREGLFYYDNPDGDGESSVTKEELLECLASSASCITPAAGLRPITQDAALPTAITVVGPGELRYFAQLKGVYELNGVAMPLIYRRMNVTILEPPARRIVDKFGLDIDALYSNFDSVRADVLLKLHGHSDAIHDALRTIESSSDALFQHIQSIDPTLEQPVDKGSARIHAILSQLRDKSARALAERDDIYAHQFARLQTHLLPLGQRQERLLSPFSYFLKFGIQPVLQELLELPPEGHQVVRF